MDVAIAYTYSHRRLWKSKRKEVRAAQRLKSGLRSQWWFCIDLPSDEDVVIKTNGVLLRGDIRIKGDRWGGGGGRGSISGSWEAEPDWVPWPFMMVRWSLLHFLLLQTIPWLFTLWWKPCFCFGSVHGVFPFVLQMKHLFLKLRRASPIYHRCKQAQPLVWSQHMETIIQCDFYMRKNNEKRMKPIVSWPQDNFAALQDFSNEWDNNTFMALLEKVKYKLN